MGHHLVADAVMAGWPEGRELAAGELAHGDDGVGVLELPGLKPGAYRVIYTTVDDYGATFSTSRDFVVAGQQRAEVALPALLLAERSSVAVGDTARLLVRSGLRNQTMVLETYRDGRRTARRVLHSGSDDELIELPITEADRGGFSVVLTVLRDHQLIRQTTSVFVPWDDRRLEVGFTTFRDTMRPGTRETFRVTVKVSTIPRSTPAPPSCWPICTTGRWTSSPRTRRRAP